MRKARQRKAKAHSSTRKARRQLATEDRSFAAAILRNARKSQPHLVWNRTSFIPGRPAPSPTLRVNVEMMHAAHERFGSRWKGSRKGIYRPTWVESVGDTGCQTCTIGVDISRQFCPDDYLIPTRHKIVGITDASLKIIGMAMLRITSESGAQTRQAVYVSENVNGMYLSESALKDLGIIHPNFPRPIQETRCQSGTIDEQDEEVHCKCIPRSSTPERPDALPFPATPENIPRLKEWLLKAFASSAFNICSHQQLQTMTGAPVRIKFKEGAHPVPCIPQFRSRITGRRESNKILTEMCV